jgi:glycosyltransferase involved in cell wall biosynthesis
MSDGDSPAHLGLSPLVSIIVANHNGAAYLADSVRSACRQSLRDIEIIISDDASTDASIAVAQKLAAQDPRVRLITNHSNTGPAAARNRAIKQARGEWIAILDSGDLMHPERIEMLIRSARIDGADIVADDLIIFDSQHRESPRPLLRGRWAKKPSLIDIATYVRANHVFGRDPTLGSLKPMIRRSMLTNLSGPYDENQRIGEDYNLVFRLLRRGARFWIYPTLHYFYRKNAASISFRPKHEILAVTRAADMQLLDSIGPNETALVRALSGRIRSIDAAMAYEQVLDALQTRGYCGAFAMLLRQPRAGLVLRLLVGIRLRRLTGIFSDRSVVRKHDRRRVCVISRQRIIGRTNGSSSYLMAIVAALQARDIDVNYISPSPTTLGRWPYLKLRPEMKLFQSFRIRGTWRIGRYLVAKNPRNAIKAALATIEKALINAGILRRSYLQPAPYSIAQPLTRKDQLFLARHLPQLGHYLIADYCFLTDTFPFALNPAVRTAVIMHDLFSARGSEFLVLETSHSVAALTEDDELRKLSRADSILAIQADEAKLVRSRLSDHSVLVLPMAARPVSDPVPGDGSVVLFVGGSNAPNIDGLRWFLTSCWPQIHARSPNIRFLVAGTVSEFFGPPPIGVVFLGLVDDLLPLYRQAGLVISPLRAGSGLKIKLIEALEQGKAVVASPVTLQGVGDTLTEAVCVADGAPEFVDAILSLLADGPRRTQLAARGLEALRRHSSPEACYGAFVDEVLQSTGLPPPGMSNEIVV